MLAATNIILVILGFIMGYCVKGLSGDGSIINIYTAYPKYYDDEDEL